MNVRNTLITVGLITASLLLAACRPVQREATPASTPAEQAAVTGTVTYRERMALPPEAVITVQLSDVSKADAPAELISEQTIQANGQQPPYAFTLPYDPTTIIENHTYAVRATIKVDNQLLFTSTTMYPVITRGNPTEVEVVVEKVG